MATTSTTAIEDQLRTRLLTFEPMGGGSTLSTLLSDRLYITQAPDDVDQSAWAVMRLKNRRTDPETAGERERAELEVQFFARPRSRESALNAMADVVDAAMLRYRDHSAGVVASQHRLRHTLPVMGGPVDREVVQIVCTYGLILWPTYLTQYNDV